jgi:hypothetical protein
MRYIKVKWNHNAADEPVYIYSEIDSAHWEVRKIETYIDGHSDYADKIKSTGSTMLSIEPLPDFSTIARDSEFEIEIIDKEDFEALWDKITKT